MWGICLDVLADGGKLYQRAIEYENMVDECTVDILRPISGAKISLCEIKPMDKPPAFVYEEWVSLVGYPDIIGRVVDIIWHFKNMEYNYYILVNGRKKSKRYCSEDLLKLPNGCDQ